MKATDILLYESGSYITLTPGIYLASTLKWMRNGRDGSSGETGKRIFRTVWGMAMEYIQSIPHELFSFMEWAWRSSKLWFFAGWAVLGGIWCLLLFAFGIRRVVRQ